MQRRNKVGGILDRRLGEGDPNMTPEERALERFAFEKQRIHNKKGAMFDLEDGNDEFLGGSSGLAPLGQSLAHDDDGVDDMAFRDDFNEDGLGGSDGSGDDADDGEVGYKKQLKRLRSEMLGDGDGDGAAAGDAPQRKKTKKEVMEEVIAKSKYYKYERQMAKEADDDVRAALDGMLPELQQLLATRPPPAAAASKATAAPAKPEFDKDAFEKAYDVRLRQMIQDKKADPSQRTKTEEELAEEQSAHLKKLEESRVKRMLGEIEYGADDDDDVEGGSEAGRGGKNSKEGKDSIDGPAVQILRADGADEDEFNLGQGIRVRHTAAELGFDDEDDFLIDDDLVASGSEAEPDESGSDEDDSDAEHGDDGDDSEDDEFIRGILTEEEKKSALFANASKLPSSSAGASGQKSDDDGVPYTFPCPQTHEELLVVVRGIPAAKLPTVVQRIRALHHPKLDHGNKERLGRFAAALVQHIAYLADACPDGEAPSYAAIESLIRHIHSLAKIVPVDVAVAFRAHLAAMEGVVSAAADPSDAPPQSRALALGAGDLAVLTAVAAIFPTSDHFHPVVTPSMLAMARYLEQSTPRALADYATGLYVCTLVCQYQQLSKRYVPELVNYLLSTLLALAPSAAATATNSALRHWFPIHAPAPGVRIEHAEAITSVRKLRPSDCRRSTLSSAVPAAELDELKVALFSTALALVAEAGLRLWPDKAALVETLAPCRAVLKHLRSATTAARAQLPEPVHQAVDRLAAQLDAAAKRAETARRPLELHHHRPLAIRTFVPRFEDAFDPDKHYDPNRERAEAAKLQAEFKRERKGALRELRKDAGFLQREKLKLKKARDAAYEKKFKRLVSEIQGSEGREANAYERERQSRKRR